MTPIPVEQALTLLLQAIHPIEAVERLPLGLACGRISAHTVLARLPQPPFNRSAMDGYALCSTDLTEELTLSLQSPTEALLPGHAMPITTGGLMPEGACVKSPLKNQQGNVDCLFFCVENLGAKFCVLKVSNLRTFFSTRKIEVYQACFRLFHNNFNYC